MAKRKPNAETFRLRALAHLSARDLSRARLEIKKALELEPKWVSIRFTAAIIDYHSAISPAFLPKRPVPWPEPLECFVIKHDEESLHRLRDAADLFQKLARMQTKNAEERRTYETWYLACLANDPDRQEQAANYCRSILQADGVHYGAIVWAVARNYDVDLTPNVRAIESLVANRSATISHVTALLSCYLSTGKALDAISLLERTQALFSHYHGDMIWTFWRAQALIASGDPDSALTVIEASDSGAELRDARAAALRLIAKTTGNWQAVMQHLEKSFEETKHPGFLLEACEIMTQQQDWAYIADRAERIIQEIATSEVLRVGAIASYKAERYDLCLRLLDSHRNLFKNGQLPSELRELRISCQHALGVLPEAIVDAEALARDVPSTFNLYTLAQLYLEKGDLKGATIIARRLLDRTDLTHEQFLQIARVICLEDLSLARSLWRKAALANLPDSLVGAAIGLGFQLGLDDELKPLFVRMTELGQQGLGGIQIMSVQQLLALATQHTDRAQVIEDAYRTGTAPTHAIAELVNQPLVEFYHSALLRNETAPDPLRQRYLMIRHGGRAIIEGFWSDPPKWRLNVDISALLLANHLGILTNIERVYAPLRIPAILIPTLLFIRDKETHHQPSRFLEMQQIIDFLERGLLQISNSKIPTDYENRKLVEEIGDDWAALFEAARASKGYLVDFLPLHKRDLSGPLTSLPEDAEQYIVNCRAVVETLRSQGPLSDEEYQDALEALGQEGLAVPSWAMPKEGAPLYCDRGILELFVGAKVLHVICHHFQVNIEQREVDAIRAALLYESNIRSNVAWLENLINRLREGIDKGIYAIISMPPHQPERSKAPSDNHPYLDCLRPLLEFKPQGSDVIWVDDRFVNSHSHRDGIPIIGLNEILKTLVGAKALSVSEYFENLSRLRAANVRYIPIQADEVLYYLRHARIDNNEVIETQGLSILRRYTAACFLQGNWLQRPTARGGSSPNEEGETAFMLGFSHAIANVVAEIWSADEDANVCEVRSNWIISNLWLDHLSLLTLTSLQRPDQDDRYVVAVSLAGLLIRAITLKSNKESGSLSPRHRYLAWLYKRVLNNRIEADPLLPATIADFIKKALVDSKEEVDTKSSQPVRLMLLQEFYEDLPQLIREEISRDADFMASIGFKFTIDIAGVRFDPNVYWRAAADAINGREVSIEAIKPQKVVTFEPQSNSNGQAAFGFEHPATGQKVSVADADYELLLASPTEQEKFLRWNRRWFDCPNEAMTQAIAEIVSTEDPARRVDKVAAWRHSSATAYYDDLGSQLRDDKDFDFIQLVPRSAEGLLRHFRLKIEFLISSSFPDALTSAAEVLIQEEGLQVAIERLVRLPVALPQPIFDAIALLHPNEILAIVKGLIQEAGSPLSQIHCVHLLSRLGDKRPTYRRLARRIIARLSSAVGAEEFEAFLTILRWVNAKFHHWPDVQTWPSHARLAMVWAHSHQLFTIFLSAGAPIAWMTKTFSQLEKAIVSEVFGRDPAYWFDIAHPRRVGWAPFVLTGSAYAIGDDSALAGDETLRQLFERLVFHYIDSRRLPNLLLLQDVTRATNSLGSFLGGERAETLSKLLTHDDANDFARQSLKALVEEALNALEQANSDLSAWATIFAVLGDFASDENLTDRLRSLILQTKFADLFVEDWHLGNLALQTATSQIYYLGDGALHQHLTSELTRIAELLAAYRSASTSTIDEDSSTLAETKVFLFEAALKISLANSVPANAPASFGEIVAKMVEVWPAMGATAIIVIQQLCERLPILQAKQLSGLLVRLRALNARGITL